MIPLVFRRTPRAAGAGIALVALALIASACGGGGKPKVPDGSIAIVKQTPITFDDLNGALLEQLAAYAIQSKKAAPKPGSALYAEIEIEAVQTLVQQAELIQGAKDLGVSVTKSQVAAALTDFERSSYPGKSPGSVDQTKLKADLAKYGLSTAELSRRLQIKLLGQEVENKLTAGTTVSSADVTSYYNSHKSTTYKTPESRHMRQIVVAKAAQAAALYSQLQGGASFATLAKKNSTDALTKSKGGDMGTVAAGINGASFDALAFTIKANTLTAPFKDQLGAYRIIEALGPTTPAGTKPLDASLKSDIKATLLAERKSKIVYQWYTGLQKDLQGQINYLPAYAPPTAPAGTT